MGQAVHPVGYRIGFNRKWNNLSFQNQSASFLLQDFEMINYLEGAFFFNKYIIDTPYILKEGNEINIFFSFLNAKDHADKFRSIDVYRPIDLAELIKLYKHYPFARFIKSNQTLYPAVYSRSKPLESSILMADVLTKSYLKIITHSSSLSNLTLSKYLFWLGISKILFSARQNSLKVGNLSTYFNLKKKSKTKPCSVFNKFFLYRSFYKRKKVKFTRPVRSKALDLVTRTQTNIMLKSKEDLTFFLLKRLKNHMQSQLRSYTASKVNICMKPCDTFMTIPFTSATMLAKLIAYYKRYSKRNYLKFLNYLFKMAAKLKPVAGLQVLVTGRTRSSSRSKQYVYKYGRIPTQALRANIDYYYTKTVSRSGISGIKVWVYGSK